MLIQLLLSSVLSVYLSAPPSYVVEARHIKGKESVVVGKMRVKDGVVGTLADCTKHPFVTAAQTICGDFESANQPIIVVLSSGVTVKVKVDGYDVRDFCEDSVFVEVTAEVAELMPTEIKGLDSADKKIKDLPLEERGEDHPILAVQAPEIRTKQARKFTPLQLGKPLKIAIGDNGDESIELVVRR